MNSDKKKKILIILISIVFILILSIIAYLFSNNSNENEESNVTTVNNQKVSNKDNEDKIKKLKKVSESERIKIYLGDYFNYIENKDYENAYNLLYSEFKKNYFPTFEDYEKYIKNNNYPEMLSIDYDTITIRGNYYIVTVKIGDMLNNSDTIKQEKTFVLKEEDYNDYYLSFKL